MNWHSLRSRTKSKVAPKCRPCLRLCCRVSSLLLSSMPQKRPTMTKAWSMFKTAPQPPCPPCILDNLPHGCPRAQIAFEVRGWHCVDFVSCAALQACSHRSYSVIVYAESQWRTQCFGHIWPMNGAGHFGLPTWLANAYLERAGLHGECHASSSFRFAGSCWLWVAAPSRLCLSAGFGDGI